VQIQKPTYPSTCSERPSSDRPEHERTVTASMMIGSFEFTAGGDEEILGPGNYTV